MPKLIKNPGIHQLLAEDLNVVKRETCQIKQQHVYYWTSSIPIEPAALLSFTSHTLASRLLVIELFFSVCHNDSGPDPGCKTVVTSRLYHDAVRGKTDEVLKALFALRDEAPD